MDLRHRLNCLYIVCVVHLVCDCFALDLVRTSSRKPEEKPALSKGTQLNNQTSNMNKTNNLMTQQFYKKWEEKFHQMNHKMVIFSRRNINTNARSTVAPHQRNKRHFTVISHYKSPSTTPSYIEFDYLHDNDYQNSIKKTDHRTRSVTKKVIQQNHHTQRTPYTKKVIQQNHHTPKTPYTKKARSKSEQIKTSTMSTRETPFSFRLEGSHTRIKRVFVKPRSPSVRRNFQKSLLYPHIQKDNDSNTDKVIKTAKLIYKVRPTKVSDGLHDNTVSDQKPVTVNNCFNGFREPTRTTIIEQTPLKIQILSTIPPLPATVSTIPQDRVKFFEMYDVHTLQPPAKNRDLKETSEMDTLEDDANIQIRNNVENNGNHVNRRHCNIPHETSKEKKPTIESKTIEIQSQKSNASESLPFMRVQNTIPTSAGKDASTKVSYKFSISGVITAKMANWSSYPFASVYVYKPTQTHCDAAGISPHWLVASGSCLSRHRIVDSLDERSAYVTYCGEHWQIPERVAYVKSSLVHPKFSPRDAVRRLLYNIGLIQVSSSMASCFGWSPVTLMTHQYNAEPSGSIASAVGWGLDRYGTKYSSERLPHWPLSVYDALVFSDICPGSITFSSSGDGTADNDNIYCLSLPPYAGEEKDPIHGGLLLVNGKLVALYLQEERRSWGAQSAQYTGVWRLLPWILNTARETDEEALDI